MTNLEVFESQSAEIFKLLYASFPVPLDLYFHQVTPGIRPVAMFNEPVEQPTNQDEFDTYYRSFDIYAQSEEYQINHTVFSATVQWLSDSGYLKFGRASSYESFDQVVLTAKGLEVLKCTPSSIDGSLSIGEKLQDEVVSTGSDVARDMVRQLLREGLSFALGA